MKKIKLNNTKDKYVLVDDEDFSELNKTIWTYSESNKLPYVVRTKMMGGKVKFILMHRQIMGLISSSRKIGVDHINHDRLDNRKSNLRLCNQQQNCSNNTRIFKNKKFKYKGVEFRGEGRSKPWTASKGYKGKLLHLGYFKTIEEAAEAFNKKSLELSGEFAVLNVIN